MIGFLFRKMWKNKWLLLCLLAGNILLIGIASATPMYSTATITRMLHQSMRLRQIYENIYPVTTQINFRFNQAADPLSAYAYTRNHVIDSSIESLIVPVTQTVQTHSALNWFAEPAYVREAHARNRTRRMNLWAVENFQENITLIHGRMPSESTVHQVLTYQDSEGEMVTRQVEIIEVIAMEAKLYRHNLLMDEPLRVTNVYQIADEEEDRKPYIFIKIVGLFDLPEESLTFWAIPEIDFAYNVLISEELMQNRLVANYHNDYSIIATWTTIHDFGEMTGGNIPAYLSGIDSIRGRFRGMNFWTFDENYRDLLEEQLARANEFSTTLIILQVPLYFLLAFYIYVVSRKILQLEQNEISVLKSRGASRLQIFMLYVGQGFIIGLTAFPVGIAFGVGICRILGASSGFLELMGRAPIIVEISSRALIFGGVAALFSFCAMIFPVIRFSRVGILEHKLTKRGKPKKSVWQRYFLDLICLGVSIYAVYNFNIQQELLGTDIRDFIDPTLFLASTLFMIGLGLLCLRIFPYVLKLVFFIGRRFMPISLYTALVRVSRSSGEEQFIMIFLVLTMAIGIFSAQAARTINLNSEHEIRYLGATDLIVREAWQNNVTNMIHRGAPELIFSEPSFERFINMEEAEALTRVMNLSVTATNRRTGNTARIAPGTQLLAIEPQSFGETVWFRDDFLPIHLNYYLNVLSQVPNGVLVSENFREMGFVVGDLMNIYHTRTISGAVGSPLIIENSAERMVVVGFVELFPGFMPRTRVELPDGNIVSQENHLVIGNLGHFRTQWGVWPYEIWIRTNTDSNQFMYDFANEENLSLATFQNVESVENRESRAPLFAINDITSTVARNRLDPLIQGTNGVLTVNFIATLLICFSGFLIYWLLSIRERVLQFGIFRAMGMGMRSIIALLINEQFFITILALIIGATVGEITARLYVPLIQLAYSNQIIPLTVVMQARDYANLYIVMAAMILFCLAVLIAFISKIRIDQALKLGED
ncbi:MAG: ABC transporter permease [Defluviitaleaceae bacterium]|nr:ABC transporter permease [Defluviitaleaceae bacterium]